MDGSQAVDGARRSLLSSTIQHHATYINEEDGFRLYRLHTTTEKTYENGMRVVCVGDGGGSAMAGDRAMGGLSAMGGGRGDGRGTKCVLLLGETGAGKSTFVDAIINYLYNVNFEDDFRLCVTAVEGDGDGRKSTQSQTDAITVFKIRHREGMRQDSHLVIMDTPGLADTRGPEQQKLIMNGLETFFTYDHDIEDLHCLGIVANATRNRCSKLQKDIVKDVMQLLGRHVPEITNIIATHATEKPKVGLVMREAGLEFKTILQFDNYAVFAPRTWNESRRARQQQILALRWEIWEEQFKPFFSALNEAEPVSFKVLRDMKYRDLLDRFLKPVKSRILKFAGLLAALDINRIKLLECRLKEEINKGYKIEREVKKKIREQTEEGSHSHNCPKCNRTCVFCPPKDRFTQVVGEYVDWTYEGTAQAVALPKVNAVVGAVAGGTLGGLAGLGAGVGNALSRSCRFIRDKSEKCPASHCGHPVSLHKQEEKRIVEIPNKELFSDPNMMQLYNAAVLEKEEILKQIKYVSKSIQIEAEDVVENVEEMIRHIREVWRHSQLSPDPFDQLMQEVRQGQPEHIPYAAKVLTLLANSIHTARGSTASNASNAASEDVPQLLTDISLYSWQDPWPLRRGACGRRAESMSGGN